MRDATFAVAHVHQAISRRHALRKQAIARASLSNPMSSATYDDYGEYVNGLAQAIAQSMAETFSYQVSPLHRVTIYSQDHVGHPNSTGNRGELVLTHGVTHAFSLACGFLLKCARLAGVRPAIVIPTPTYGLFAETLARESVLSSAARRGEDGRYVVTKRLQDQLQQGFFPLFIQRNHDGSVDPHDLVNALAWVKKHGKDFDPPLIALSYYDSNPNNPTGHIRGSHETRQLADIISQHNAKAPLLQLEDGDSWHPALIPIDDAVYHGTQFDGESAERLGLFCHHLESPSVLMYGPSKVGAAQHRVGAMLAPEAMAHWIRQYLFDSQYLCSLEQLLLMDAFLCSGDAALEEERRQHFRAMSGDHALGSGFFKALINGGCQTQDIETWTRIYLDSAPATDPHSLFNLRRLLTDGVRGIHIITSPDAGFFHIVDVTAWKGYLPETLGRAIQDSTDVWRWCDIDFNLVFGPGMYFDFDLYKTCPRFGLEHPHFPTNDEKLLIRINTAVQPPILLEVAARLDAANRQAQNETSSTEGVCSHADSSHH